MGKIGTYDLISGRDIAYEGICTLRPPTLSSISDITYSKYNDYLIILTMDLEKYLEVMQLQELFERFDEETKKECTVFDFLIARPDTRELLLEALWFFIAEKLAYDVKNTRFLIFNDNLKPIGYIDRSNYEDVKYGIMQINYLAMKEVRPKKYRNSKAKEIFEMISKGKKESSKNKKADENMNLPNLISSVAAHHNSYNLNNIWSLTVYQLYDQFFRLNTKVQLDVVSTRWAAWGKEDFDFSVWYKDLNSKK